jgi:hypothetical protein
MRKISILIAAAFLVLLFVRLIHPAQTSPISRQRTEWIAASLKEMEQLKVGMTRADLLKVFTTEGGLSTGLQRKFVYRDCPYIKVDVEFEPVGRPARDPDGRVTFEEDRRDVITRISQPYLEWSILD